MQYFFRHIKVYMFVLDLIALDVALILASCVVKNSQWIISLKFLSLLVSFDFIWVFLSLMKNFYDNYDSSDSIVLFRKTYRQYSLFFVFSGMFIFLLNPYVNDSWLFVFESIFFAMLLVALRIVIFALRKKYRHKIKPLSNVVIVGNKQIIEKIYDSISEESINYNILGIFSSSLIAPNGHPASHLYKGNLSDCIEFIQAKKVQEVLCSVKEFSTEEINNLINEADKLMIRVKLLLDYENILNKRGEISTQFDIPILTIRSEPLEEERNKIMKRAFDVVFSAMVLILIMSWLTPILILLIRLESKGKAIFIQLRSGKNNEAFKCYKFRSMSIDNSNAAQQASKNDKRVTKIGAFMRRTNIDELPQFWNVLIGDMSIVGPRPHMLAHTKYYKALLDNFMIRHLVKPGITGWAQINGYRGETRTLEAMEERVKYDIEYMEKWSFFLDLKIIFLTVWKTFKGDEKAY